MSLESALSPRSHEPVFIAGRWRKADHRCRSLASGSPGLLARIDGGEAEADCYWCQAQEESQGEQCVRRIRPVGHHRVAKKGGGETCNGTIGLPH